jgi:CRISPR-associated exonuclease Cas4
MYHEEPQVAGNIAHENIDRQKYSSSKRYIQSMPLYSEKYKLIGKLDIYDTKTKSIIERKNKIKVIYDGYKYQLYAQYFCLIERGYDVKHLYLHSLTDNKRYLVPLPKGQELKNFESTLNKIWRYTVNPQKHQIPKAKLENCIYRNLYI